MFSRIAPKVAHLFRSFVRTRGQSCYQRGTVRIRRGTAVSVEATVSGSYDYRVEVEFEDGELSFYCSCAYFGTEGPCKHLWATLLAAEARGFLSGVELTGGVTEAFGEL